MTHHLPRAAVALVLALAAAVALAGPSSADLQGQINATQNAAAALRAAVAADSAQIAATGGSLRAAEAHLAAVQGDLRRREDALRRVQSGLLAARDRLVDLENRLRLAAADLSANLVAQYEGAQPNLMTVILQAHGFSALLEQLTFLQRVGNADADIVAATRSARRAVTREVGVLAGLEARDRTLTEQVLRQRDAVAAWQSALLSRQIDELRARSAASSRLGTLTGRLRTLEARAAAEAAAEEAAARASVGGVATAAAIGPIAVDTGGMVQPPPGAPAAVAEVIAAGNAIATLPYIYGGGHASFHADGYDCSGSVSYALAAAGLVSAPMTSGEFESWGEPGPGRWITIYANAGHVWMEVAGWRFDTVAQASSGTRWAQGGGEFAGFVVRHPAGL